MVNVNVRVSLVSSAFFQWLAFQVARTLNNALRLFFEIIQVSTRRKQRSFPTNTYNL